MILSEYLKEETKKSHALTEKTMDAKAIFSDNYSTDSYLLHLKQILKAQSIINEIIKSSVYTNQFKNEIPCLKLTELQHDLLQINNKKVAVKVALQSKELFNNLPAFVGMLYVVRGSELGRNVISKAISKHLKNWQKLEAKFYQEKNTEEVSTSWIQFCATINNLSKDKLFFNKAVSGAKLAFDVYANPDAYANITITESE